MERRVLDGTGNRDGRHRGRRCAVVMMRFRLVLSCWRCCVGAFCFTCCHGWCSCNYRGRPRVGCGCVVVWAALPILSR